MHGTFWKWQPDISRTSCAELAPVRALPKHTPKGLADILVVKDGRAIFLEVKNETGRPSQDQLDFGRDVMAAGADYRIVRSIEDVQAAGL